MRRPSAGLTVVALLAVAACPASAGIAGAGSLSISPKKPRVDQTLSVSYRVARQLPNGWEYGFAVVGRFVLRGASITSVEKTSDARPPAGGTVRVSLASSDAALANPGAHWCQGAASVAVGRFREGSVSHNYSSPLASLNFRFYGLR